MTQGIFAKKTIKDIDIKGKRILLRADYNVPINENGIITDDYRIQRSLPTLKYLLEQKCKIIICSHLGRPEGQIQPRYSLKPVAKRLKELLKTDVDFAADCIGKKAKDKAAELKNGQILLLENLRFHIEEESNDERFAKQLASYGQVFVQDGFGVVHRAHASTDAITRFVPSVAGLLLEQEVQTILGIMQSPVRPLMAVIGGAKIADKIEILKRFIDHADFVAVGGAMANTFLLSEGIDIGSSLVDKEEIGLARHILDQARKKSKAQRFIFYLPQDGIASKKIDSQTHTRIVDWDAHLIADIEAYPKQPKNEATKIAYDEKILDIGPFSGAFIAGGMQLANTVIWNGTMGVTETPALHGPIGPFSHGTELIIDAMIGQFGHKPFSFVGGGDTVGYIESRKLVNRFDFVSTGGGASLELMSGKELPGVQALLDK